MLRLLEVARAGFCWATVLLAAGVALPRAAAQPVAALETPARILTNAAQLRALSPAEAARPLPVQLRGVVTAVNPSSIFIQDDTGGTFITVRSAAPTNAPGTVLLIQGVTYVGRFFTGIADARFQEIGHAELPAAVPVSFDDLLSARWHYQRVEVRGIVHSIARAPDSDRLVLTVALGARQLEVQIAAPGVTNLPALVDARVRIAGLAAGYINDRRQLVAPQLMVNRLEDLRVEAPPLADPFATPLTAASALLNFSPAGISNHRVRVRGVVTHRLAGEAVFLRDGERGLLVRTAQADAARPGDVVEAVGFPAMGRFSAFLENAQFRATGRQVAPQPLPTTVTEALTGTNDANLVTIDAELLEVLENPAETMLVLRAENAAFRARLPRAALSLRNGANLRLTGVCRVEDFSFSGTGFGANPRSIELLLRSPADIVVLAAPTWWTAQRLAVAAGILLGLALIALVWIVMLRQRLRAQAAVIREKVQRETALEERHRMAREIHDTLAQSFSGLGFQLQALDASLPPGAEALRPQLETARQMVRHGQESFRRSLMNLRAQELERGDLAEALPEMARQIVAGTGIDLQIDARRPARRLPEAVEVNLLRIGQECLANAVRHAQPKRLEVLLDQEAEVVRLRIADDGAGFDPEQLKQAANGHFGWRGIRERAEQIGAKIELASQPGRGTTVTVTVSI